MNTSLPQLRIRTEYSFKKAFGKLPAVGARLAEVQAPFAAIVDNGGTWGHVRWEKEMKARGIVPGFGAEFRVECDDGVKRGCWALAEDLKAFYHFTSSEPAAAAAFADVPGVVRFAGAALKDPSQFDYVDLNPSSITQTKSALALAQATRKPLVLTCDNDYPALGDRDHYSAWANNDKVTPQHIMEPAEFRAAFWMLDDATFASAQRGTLEVMERLSGLALARAPLISVPGDLPALVEQGRQYRVAAGHIAEWTTEYQERLEKEMALIHAKEFESYFLVVADLVIWAKERMLVGPGRGSSGGSLACYLLRITEVDPIVSELLFERFVDINRNDLPDIDIDFNDRKRHLIIDYLEGKYGKDNVSKIGNVSTLKPKSVMAHVGKRLGISAGATFNVLNVLIEYSSGDARFGKGLADTLENTKPGRDFMERYPEAALMGELEGHASHTGVHAAGLLVSNNKITDYCTVTEGVAQIDKKDAEYLNLLKIDALGLRTLGVIEGTGCVTGEQLYGLKRDDPAVLKIFNDQKFSGLFQFEGSAQRRVSMQIPIVSFTQIDHITALARPGPMGGGAAGHYINRNAGREEIQYAHPSMAAYLKDTMGVVLYQEQVMRIVREIGRFSWEDTSTIRKAMSGRKGKEFFDQHGQRFAEGAATLGISKESAADIWASICSFGAWGMNKSHTTAYAVISYWCAYMKCYHPLEYAASLLRDAEEEQIVETLRELQKEGVPYIPFDAALSEESWAARAGKLIGGFDNLHGIGPVKAKFYVEKRAASGLDAKDIAALAKHAPKVSDLAPAHTKWQDMYDNPEDYNVHGRIWEFEELNDRQNAAVICKLIRKERRDQNDTVRAARRGHYITDGSNTFFLDCFVVDDSVSKPVMMRIKEDKWEQWGEVLADKGIDGEDWFLVRGRWLKQFSMIIVEKIKCLTQPEMFA